MFPSLDTVDTVNEALIGYTSAEINARSFPKLTEITGYFGVVGVTHLNSLGQMFPNLRVIRGRRLMRNFALFIYESNLREVTANSDFNVLQIFQ